MSERGGDCGAGLALVAGEGARIEERPAFIWQQGQGLGYAVRLMGAGVWHEVLGEVDDRPVLAGRARERGGEEPAGAEGGVPDDHPRPVGRPAGLGVIVGAVVQVAACGLEGEREHPLPVSDGEVASDCGGRRQGLLPVPPGLVGVRGDDDHGVAVLDRYVSHYSQHRPHRARNLRPPDGGDSTVTPGTDLTTAVIRRRRILGGLRHAKLFLPSWGINDHLPDQSVLSSRTAAVDAHQPVLGVPARYLG